MTPEERAAALGELLHRDTGLVQLLRSEIADAIRAAVDAEREACATEAERVVIVYSVTRGSGEVAAKLVAEAIRARGQS